MNPDFITPLWNEMNNESTKMESIEHEKNKVKLVVTAAVDENEVNNRDEAENTHNQDGAKCELTEDASNVSNLSEKMQQLSNLLKASPRSCMKDPTAARKEAELQGKSETEQEEYSTLLVFWPENFLETSGFKTVQISNAHLAILMADDQKRQKIFASYVSKFVSQTNNTFHAHLSSSEIERIRSQSIDGVIWKLVYLCSTIFGCKLAQVGDVLLDDVQAKYCEFWLPCSSESEIIKYFKLALKLCVRLPLSNVYWDTTAAEEFFLIFRQQAPFVIARFFRTVGPYSLN